MLAGKDNLRLGQRDLSVSRSRGATSLRAMAMIVVACCLVFASAAPASAASVTGTARGAAAARAAAARARIARAKLTRRPAVTSVAASARDDGNHITWLAARTRVAGYRVFRATRATGPYAAIATVRASATGFLDRTTPRLPDTCYYKVSALSPQTKAEGPRSPAVQATWSLVPPTGLVARAGDLENRLGWDAATQKRMAGLAVFRSPAGKDSFTKVADLARDARSHNDPIAIDQLGLYDYKVTAVSASGRHFDSAVATADILDIAEPVTPLSAAGVIASTGELELFVPAGAVAAPTTLTIRTSGPADVLTAVDQGMTGAYSFGPDGLAFAAGAYPRLTLRYRGFSQGERFEAEWVAQTAKLYVFDAQAAAWVAVSSGLVVDTAADTVSSDIGHFSDYAAGFTVMPHGRYSSTSNLCITCHNLHSATGETLARRENVDLCYYCHGAPSSTQTAMGAHGPNVRAAFFSSADQTRTGNSLHPVPDGKSFCVDCHAQHYDPDDYPKLLYYWAPLTEGSISLARWYNVKPGITGTRRVEMTPGSGQGNKTCFGCHGTFRNPRIRQGAGLPETVGDNYWTRTKGDHSDDYAGGHAAGSLAYSPPAGANDTTCGITARSSEVQCKACHADHGQAARPKLLRSSINGTSVAGNDITVCLACHTTATGRYTGSALYAKTAHSTVTASSRSLVRWPGTTNASGECKNCHDPHGTPNPDYTRADGNALCYTCHDDASTTKPTTYSYQGTSDFAGSAHSGLSGSISSAAYRSDSSGFEAWQGVTTPTPSSPGSPVSGAQKAAMLTADTTRAVTNISHTNGGYDYQMYRFELSVPTTSVIRMALDWAGFGEEMAGYPVSVYAWNYTYNAGAGGWELVQSAQMASQTRVQAVEATSTHVDSSGYVYVMAKARNVVDSTISSGPSVSAITTKAATVSWTTLGKADRWVDYGLTAGYGSVAGSATTGTSHSVNLTLTGPGLYHYRVRSTDRDGDMSASTDATFQAMGTTTLTAQPDATITPPANVTLQWAGVTCPDGDPAQYYVEYGDGTTTYNSGWIGPSSFTTGLPAGTWSWRVRVRDAVHTTSVGDWTPYDVFVLADLRAPPAPATNDLGDYYYDSWWDPPPSVTMTWSPVLAGDGDPAQYYAQLWANAPGSPGTLVAETGWTSGLSWTLQLGGSTTYYWHVRARDASHTASLGPWSAWDAFTVYDTAVGGSCPFLFTWDGSGYFFEADNFTAGRIGGPTAVGYQQPNPNDAYVLKAAPAVKDGRLSFNLVEERNEVDYLDSYGLYGIDAPEGADVYAEKAVAGKRTFPPLAQALHTVRDLRAPLSAVRTDTGEDILAAVSAGDGSVVELNESSEVDFTYRTIELDLGSDAPSAPQVKVVMNALTEFPVTEAGIQRRFTFGLPSKLEAQGLDGTWRSVPTTVGAVPVPPEFVRPYVFDLTNAVKNTTGKVRFTYLFRTLIDYIAIDKTQDESLAITPVTLASAELRYHGIDKEVGAAYTKRFVYGQSLAQGSYYPGAYTRFGDVTPLLSAIDDKFVIMGQGDEITMSFEPPATGRAGTSRSYVFSAYGYYKDNKTDLERTVEPLPFAAMSNYPYPDDEHYPDDAEHQQYRAEYNTRVEGGPAQTAGILEALGLGETPVVPAASAEVHRSLNTDYVRLDIDFTQPQVSGLCENCHAVHGSLDQNGQPFASLLTRQEGSLCTGNGSGCHALASSSVSGIDVYAKFTASGNDTAHHDVLPAAQQATGARTTCTGCHNPHTENSLTRYSKPAAIGETMTPGQYVYADPDGGVYALIGAKHDGLPPVMSNVSLTATISTAPVVTWTTDESSTSWVDWGITSTPYPTSTGSASLVKNHVVQLSGLATGTVYHWRARSADALGNESASADATMVTVGSPPAPTPADLGDYFYDSSLGPPPSVTMTWSAVAAPDGHPVQYYAEVWSGAAGPPGTVFAATGWIAGTSWTIDLPAAAFYWRVMARDSVHAWAVSDWSSWDGFNVWDTWSGGSCPFLFTWDGSGYFFEADNFTAGRIGGPTAVGYQQPNPNDAYVLKAPPAQKDGLLSFSMVEEREEVDYLDSYRLYAVDAPDGATVYAEKAVAGKRTFPPLASALHTVRDLSAPLSAARTDTGEDILSAVSVKDGTVVELNESSEVDFTYKTIELDLGAEAVAAPQVKVVMDAVTEFPVTPAGIARRFTFGLPSKLEVQGSDGTWRSVPTTVGAVPVPPEFVRPYVFDLTNAVKDTTGKVRFTYLFRTLIDYIAVDTTQDESLSITEVALAGAELRYHGVDDLVRAPDGAKRYVYDATGTPSSYYPGAYTRFGDVTPLLGAIDDKFVIMGQGDEIEMSFEPPAQGPAGTTRSYVFSAYGYYKDKKTDLEKTVEPLPFAAMSNYPYPDDEHYPDDAEHEQYRSEYNTRVEGGPAQTARILEAFGLGGSPPTAPLAGGDGDPPDDAPPVAAGQDEATHYSVNTDRVLLNGVSTTQAVTTYTAVAGWQSQGTTAPSPTAPGTSVDATTLARASSVNGSYWVTDLTATDARWNWQVVKFQIPQDSLATVGHLRLSWYGHGEPTPGYPTAVYLWNRGTNSWEQMGSATPLGSDGTLGGQVVVSAVLNSFCLACHTSSPPPNVYFPSALANMNAMWANNPSANSHGAYSSGAVSGGFVAPYATGYEALLCTTCHDVHGNGSVYHLVSEGTTMTNGVQAQELCLDCHTGGMSTWHSACTSCHAPGYEHGDITGLIPNTSSDCLACHNHNTSVWTHPYWDEGCHGCDDPYGYTRRGF